MGRKFLIFISILVLFFYGLYYFVVPAIFNNPNTVSFIEKNIQQKTGMQISLKNPKLRTGFIPSIEFAADDIDMLNNDGSKALYITNLNVNVRLLPLIIRRVNIRQLYADEIFADLKLDKDSKIYLGQYELKGVSDSSFGINPKYINIKNLHLDFYNEAANEIFNIVSKTETIDDKDSTIKSDIFINNQFIINSELNTINNGIIIKNLKIVDKSINASLSGTVTKLNTKLPNLDLKVNIGKSKAEEILKLLPSIPNPDIDIKCIKNAGFWGNVTGNLEIKGRADTPNVYGNVLINEAYAVKPIANSPKATIKLLFTGNKVDLDVYVPTSQTQKVWVKGPIELYNDKSADLHITSTGSVDLKTTQIVLNPLHEVFYFDLGPVPIMDINGLGGINLRVTGTRENPHAWGIFHFKNAKVSFLDIHNMIINNGSGSLTFDNQSTLFETKTAFLNGKPISIKGTCTLLGVLDFNVLSDFQDINKLLNTIKTSPMLKDVQNLVKPIENATGLANISINLTGQVKDVNDIVFNKNLFAKGTINLLNNSIKLIGAPSYIKGIKGVVKFNNMDADIDLTSLLNTSEIKLSGQIKNDSCDIKINSSKFNLKDAVAALPIKILDEIANINMAFDVKYKGKTDRIELDKIFLKGKTFSNQGSKNPLIVNNSNFELNNGNLRTSKLQGTFYGSPYYLNISGNKIFSKNRTLSGFGKISAFDIDNINKFKSLHSKEIPEQLKDIEFLDGKTDLTFRLKNNNYNVYAVLDNISINYKPNDLKVIFHNGSTLLHNGILNINKVNVSAGNMPIFVDGKVLNIFKNPNLSLYLNLKPTQDFVDQFFNKNSIYPIKLKGDTIITSRINGLLNNLSTKSTLDIKENSSIYYMGSTIGDVENPVKITLDSIYSPNRVKINNLQYDKIIMSQNNKPHVNTQLNVYGILSLLKDGNLGFNNFNVKTQNPTDAKIFNIIFRKPFMKQGVFTSDLVLNGNSVAPKIFGKLNISSIDIPLFDSKIRDINLDFKPDKIHLSSTGKVLTNDVILDAIMRNNLIPPYVIDNIKLEMDDLNINKITDTLRDMEAESTKNLSIRQNTSSDPIDISQLIINRAEIFANKIQVRNINADNFVASLKLDSNQVIDVSNFKFDIAQGIVNGNFNYNIPRQITKLDIHLNNANAAIMSEALFDLKGQVYGLVNGDFNLSCIGNTNDDCFKTLTGGGTFKVSDGRMPKLGSLEYLLKAGNIWKGGLAGLSINSLVDLVTPLKTGDFDSISGDINITKGVADKINIYSSGHDLNMYMTGSYNIISAVADMKIFGSLSKNITTVFGKIKNASLHTLFNTIPGVNDNTEKLLLQTEVSKIPNIRDVTDIYRIFTVEINGDINGTNYVKSFRWVK